MKKRSLAAIAAFAILTTGCAGLIQTGTITKAYETYESRDFPGTLKLITQAESLSNMTPDLRAELTYLRAKTYREMGKTDKANILLQYLREQHRTSQYGYLAARQLAVQE